MTIRGLIEAVERGDMPNFCPMFHAQGLCTECEGALLGSLDAAKALHDALLPGWRWQVACGELTTYVHVTPPAMEMGNREIGADDNPARAWLLAILRALEGDA
jgi:hypothetical protein